MDEKEIAKRSYLLKLLSIELQAKKDAIGLITGNVADYLDVEEFDELVYQVWSDNHQEFYPHRDLFPIALDYVVKKYDQLRDYDINSWDELQDEIEELQSELN